MPFAQQGRVQLRHSRLWSELRALWPETEVLGQSEAARRLGMPPSFLGLMLMLETIGLVRFPDPLPEPDDIVESEELASIVRERLKTLTVREQTILTMRFGLDGDEPKTLSDTGAAIKRSKERARQIQAKALRKLRHPSRSKYITRWLAKRDTWMLPPIQDDLA